MIMFRRQSHGQTRNNTQERKQPEPPIVRLSDQASVGVW